MFTIKVLSISRWKEPWLQEVIASYEQRLKRFFYFEWILCKEPKEFLVLAHKETSPILLDPKGILLTSTEWSTSLFALLEKQKNLTFLIGGDQGFPIGTPKGILWSLSPLTFPHHLCRLLLIEQIYRSFSIREKTPYHK